MSLLATVSLKVLSLKYGIALGKIIYGLKTGDYKYASEAFLKASESQGADKAKALAAKVTANSILEKVANQLQDDPDWNGTREEQEEAAAEAGETLGAGFSFDTLARNLDTPEALPEMWLERRLNRFTDHRWRRAVDLNDLSKLRQDALLKATAQALVETPLPDLPGFHNWYIGFNVKNSDELSEYVLMMLGKQGEEDALFEKYYRNALIRHHNKVELFIEPGRIDDPYAKQTLTVAYVTLNLTQGREQSEETRLVMADGLLSGDNPNNPHVFVVGKAGSGKTTLLRWLAIQAAQQGLAPTVMRLHLGEDWVKGFQPDTSEWRDKVPLLVRLRFWEDGLPTPEKFLERGETYDSMPAGWALRILQARRGLVLLDGLDELSPESRSNALEWISNLTADYPGNLFVVSSRPQAVDEGALKQAGFREYAVQELSYTGKIEFINRWHEAVAARLNVKLDATPDLLNMRRRMLKALEENSSIIVLASNPLLCALMCAINRFYQEDQLPSNLHDLCKTACQMLLWDRDARQQLAQGVSPPGYANLSKADRYNVAQFLAYTIVKERGAALPVQSALANVGQALGLKPNENPNLCSDVLKGLILRSNLVHSSGRNHIEFVHNNLRDHLAAMMFVQYDEWEYLIENLDMEGPQRWEPIILFAAATEERKSFAMGIMESLLQLPEVENKDKRLCRQLVTLKAKSRLQFLLPSAMETQINSVRHNIGKIDTKEKAVALAAIGETAIYFMIRQPNMGVDEETASIHGLSQIGSEEALRQRQRYLRSDAHPDTLEALAQYLPPNAMAAEGKVNVLFIPSVMKRIKELTGHKNPYAPHIRDCDLQVLSGLTGLQWLDLNNTQVCDISVLSGLTRLERLDLNNTQVSDISALSGLMGLQWLSLSNTQVREEEVERFKQSRRALGLHGVHMVYSIKRNSASE